MLASLLFLSPFANVVETACDPSGPAIESIGTYANWRNTEEHQYGYGLQLWKQGEELFGLLRVAEGHLVGDVPIGVLEDVEFNPETERLAFRSKLSLGMVSEGMTSATDYSRDLYLFSGTLQAGHVQGSVERRDGSGKRRTVSSNEVVLERDASANTAGKPNSCGEWIKLWGPVMQAWGPKW